MRTEARRECLLEPGLNPTGQIVAATTPPSKMEVSPSLSVAQTPAALRYCAVAIIAVLGLGWDLWTKNEVFSQLGYRGTYPVWKGQLLGVSIRFQFETTFNHGALWGMGQGQTALFASLSFVAIGAIGYFLWNRQAVASRWLTVVTGLLLAGTLGNLYDRLGLHGWKNDRGEAVHAVRDFLDFYFFNDSFHWATFNFADTYLVVGACMLILHSLWTPVDDPAETAKSTTA